MVKKEICFVVGVLIISNAYAYIAIQRAAIRLFLDPVGIRCANETGVTQADVEAATETRDITKIPPCFFTCFLKGFFLIKEIFGREILNVPGILLFAKLVIPTISVLNILPFSGEFLTCVAVFDSITTQDNVAALSCPKTDAFLRCLVNQTVIIDTIILANRSLIAVAI